MIFVKILHNPTAAYQVRMLEKSDYDHLATTLTQGQGSKELSPEVNQEAIAFIREKGIDVTVLVAYSSVSEAEQPIEATFVDVQEDSTLVKVLPAPGGTLCRLPNAEEG
jgi:hypothetical protein